MKRNRLLGDLTDEMDRLGSVTAPDVTGSLADVSSQAAATRLPVADLSGVLSDLGFDVDVAAKQSEESFKNMGRVLKKEARGIAWGINTMKIRILDDLEELVSGEKSFRQFAKDVAKTLLTHFITSASSVQNTVRHQVLDPMRKTFSGWFDTILGLATSFGLSFLDRLFGGKKKDKAMAGAVTEQKPDFGLWMSPLGSPGAKDGSQQGGAMGDGWSSFFASILGNAKEFFKNLKPYFEKFGKWIKDSFLQPILDGFGWLWDQCDFEGAGVLLRPVGALHDSAGLDQGHVPSAYPRRLRMVVGPTC